MERGPGVTIRYTQGGPLDEWTGEILVLWMISEGHATSFLANFQHNSGILNGGLWTLYMNSLSAPGRARTRRAVGHLGGRAMCSLPPLCLASGSGPKQRASSQTRRCGEGPTDVQESSHFATFGNGRYPRLAGSSPCPSHEAGSTNGPRFHYRNWPCRKEKDARGRSRKKQPSPHDCCTCMYWLTIIRKRIK